MINYYTRDLQHNPHYEFLPFPCLHNQIVTAIARHLQPLYTTLYRKRRKQRHRQKGEHTIASGVWRMYCLTDIVLELHSIVFISH